MKVNLINQLVICTVINQLTAIGKEVVEFNKLAGPGKKWVELYDSPDKDGHEFVVYQRVEETEGDNKVTKDKIENKFSRSEKAQRWNSEGTCYVTEEEPKIAKPFLVIIHWIRHAELLHCRK